MKLGMWSVDRSTLRTDGLVLFSKLIRTKNVQNLQEQQPRTDERKLKLTYEVVFKFGISGLKIGKSWLVNLRSIDKMSTSRCYSPRIPATAEIELHTFSDSSKKVFAAIDQSYRGE
ncbi:hypothetical protein JTB14_025652 [Gonioctena quinquepunctata]|nr:hypothetical protein JTB14_025652 [Gonioctena quinquepunctata]